LRTFFAGELGPSPGGSAFLSFALADGVALERLAAAAQDGFGFALTAGEAVSDGVGLGVAVGVGVIVGEGDGVSVATGEAVASVCAETLARGEGVALDSALILALVAARG
jgi:hypothetical protein